jgi:hypothetical protein
MSVCFLFLFSAREATKLATVLENFTLSKSDEDYDFNTDFKET